MSAAPVSPQRSASAVPFYDIGLLFPVLFLVGIGIVMVYSASSAMAIKRFGSDYYFLKKQAMFSLAGVVALVACRHIPYRLYRPLSYPLLLVALCLLLAVPLTGLGVSVGGAARWLRIGPFSLQPAEAARVAMVIYLSYSMSKKIDRLDEFTIGFVPHVIVLGIFTAVISAQPDFGAIVILAALTYIMLFIGGVRTWHLIASLLLLAPMAYLYMISAAYRISRLVSFLNPWDYATKEGYQTVHSLMAFGSGGLWGTGIGKGVQKLFYLPEPHTDFIFSVIGEELGLVGVMIILILYGLIIWRGLHIASTARDHFGSFLASGLTIGLALQICVNIGVTMGLLPTKGLTLPFLSYGGTSLVVSMACIGILLNIGAGRQKA
ncbi:MAG: putative lipid II flippase FtsW [Pseudomonadota bacterium]